jgi:hypothetical protein
LRFNYGRVAGDRFARLADDNGLDHELETEKNEAVAFEWVKIHGLPGVGAEASCSEDE